MVKIRLRRMGAKKYSVLPHRCRDSRYPRDGRFIEEIGTFKSAGRAGCCQRKRRPRSEWIVERRFSRPIPFAVS